MITLSHPLNALNGLSTCLDFNLNARLNCGQFKNYIDSQVIAICTSGEIKRTLSDSCNVKCIRTNLQLYTRTSLPIIRM